MDEGMDEGMDVDGVIDDYDNTKPLKLGSLVRVYKGLSGNVLIVLKINEDGTYNLGNTEENIVNVKRDLIEEYRPFYKGGNTIYIPLGEDGIPTAVTILRIWENYYVIPDVNGVDQYYTIASVDRVATRNPVAPTKHSRVGGSRRTRRNKLRKKRRKTNRRKSNRRR